MSKKKILYLSLSFPFPADGGGKYKTFQTLSLLAQHFDVFAIFLDDHKISLKNQKKLRSIGIRFKIFVLPQISKQIKADMLGLLRNFLCLRPYHQYQYSNATVAIYILQKINTWNPSVIHVDHVTMAQYLPKDKKQHWFLEQHNIEHQLLFQRFLYESHLKTKMYLLIESLLTYRFERMWLKACDSVFAISSTDAAIIKNVFHIKQVIHQPLVYEPHPSRKHVSKKVKNILFIGNLSWPPNADAVEWFAHNVFPLIVSQVDMKLIVIGDGKENVHLQDSINKQIVFVGHQKLLNSHLAESAVCVLPFRIGGGIRIKALEAMAHRIPIVTTKVGILGLDVQHEKQVLLAEESKEFAQAVVQVVCNPSLAYRLENASVTYLRNFHSSKSNQAFLKIYQKLVDNL